MSTVSLLAELDPASRSMTAIGKLNMEFPRARKNFRNWWQSSRFAFAMTAARKDQKVTPRTWVITGVNSGFGRYMMEQLFERASGGSIRALEVCQPAFV